MKTILASLGAVVLLVLAASWKPHEQSSDPKTHFAAYLDKNKFEEMAVTALPTLAQCKAVFTDSAAEVYHTYVENMMSKGTPVPGQTELFVEVDYETFTTEDVKAGKGNYAGGMERIKSFLQPGITFYKIELLREKGAEHGMAYNSWVYIQGHWVFFPKPWKGFKS